MSTQSIANSNVQITCKQPMQAASRPRPLYFCREIQVPEVLPHFRERWLHSRFDTCSAWMRLWHFQNYPEQWNQDNPSHSIWKTIHENTCENFLLISSRDNHNQATKFPQIWKIGWIKSKKSCWKSFLRSQRTISLETRNSNPSHTREKCLQQQWTKDVSERRHCRQSQRNRNSPHPAADGIHRLQTSSNISCKKSVYIYTYMCMYIYICTYTYIYIVCVCIFGTGAWWCDLFE